MVIWAPESPDGVWTPTVRVGDIGGQLGGSGKIFFQTFFFHFFSNFFFKDAVIA